MRQTKSAVFFLFLAAMCAFLPGSIHAQGLLTKPQLGIVVGASFPRGELNNDAAPGWNAGSFFEIRVRGNLDARVEGAWNRLGARDFEGDFGKVVLASDVWYALGGIALNLAPDSAFYPGDRSVSPYLLLGIGAYGFGSEATCTGLGCIIIDTERYTTTRTGISFGGGANFPFYRLPLVAEVRFHRFGVNFPGNRVDGHAWMITTTGGFKIR